MKESTPTPIGPEEEVQADDPKQGEIVVPRWVILVTFVFGWGAGGAILAVELLGQGRFPVMALGAWLITLPLVAANPFAALREIVTGVFGGRK
jgi:hypothetical protein